MSDPSVIEIDEERALHWLGQGAQPSDPVRVLLEKVGIWEQFRPGDTRRVRQPKQPTPQAPLEGPPEEKPLEPPTAEQTPPEPTATEEMSSEAPAAEEIASEQPAAEEAPSEQPDKSAEETM